MLWARLHCEFGSILKPSILLSLLDHLSRTAAYALEFRDFLISGLVEGLGEFPVVLPVCFSSCSVGEPCIFLSTPEHHPHGGEAVPLIFLHLHLDLAERSELLFRVELAKPH